MHIATFETAANLWARNFLGLGLLSQCDYVIVSVNCNLCQLDSINAMPAGNDEKSFALSLNRQMLFTLCNVS